MDHFIFLHGFGDQHNGAYCHVAEALRELLREEGIELQCETYHPGGDISATRYASFLVHLRERVKELTKTGKVHLVGYSVGGLLAASFATQYPSLVTSLLLLAPAIDNYERNWRTSACPFGQEFVRQLLMLPDHGNRPFIDTAQVPTIIVHGLREDDNGGSDPWRMRQWVAGLQNVPGSHVELHTPDADHSLADWINSCEAPSMRTLVKRMLAANRAAGDPVKSMELVENPEVNRLKQAQWWDCCRPQMGTSLSPPLAVRGRRPAIPSPAVGTRHVLQPGINGPSIPLTLGRRW